MKTLGFVLLPCLLLAACGPAAQATLPSVPTVPTAYDTLTPLPTGTATLVASLTPSQASTLSPIRTPESYPPPETATPLPTLLDGQPLTLTSLRMLDLRIGWATEAAGHILRTTDGGTTWQDVTPPDGIYQAANFYTLDATHAWAIGRSSTLCGPPMIHTCPTLFAWRTADAGASWQKGLPRFTDNGYRPVALRFSDAQTGRFLYVSTVGMSGSTYMGFILSQDGGATWTLSGGLDSGLCLVSGLTFSDPRTGWAGTDCRVVTAMDGVPLKDFLAGKVAPSLSRTQDGGFTWEEASLPPPQVFPASVTSPDVDPAYSLFCGVSRLVSVDGTTILLEWSCSLSKGTAQWPPDFVYDYLTTDGGGSWHSWLASGSEDFVSSSTGFRLFHLAGEANPRIQRTADGGLTWVNIHTVAWPAAQLDFLDRQNGWALVTGNDGAFALVRTTDGGGKWLDLKPVLAASSPPALTTPTPTPAPRLASTEITIKNIDRLTELARRQGDACGAAWSPDGALLALGSPITLYDAQSLNPVATLDSSSCNLAFSPDGKLLGVVERGELQLWQVPAGTLLDTLSADSYVQSLAFSPDGALIASGHLDGSVRLWNAADRSLKATLAGHSESVMDLAFSPDGSLLASGSQDKTIRLWDVSTGQSTATLTGHTNYVTGLAYSPDGKLLASGSADSTVRLWQLPLGAPLIVLPGSSLVSGLAFSPDGTILAAGSREGPITLWDTVTWQAARRLEGHTFWVYGLAFSPDGMRLVSASLDGSWRMWGIPTP